jgi:RNA-directed DNA polymerase
VLANLFLHYAFDMWMVQNFPTVKFERYVDDAVVHCVDLRQAEMLRGAIGQRMAEVGLQLHPDKTRIPWVAILRIRGSRPEVKLKRNTSASSEGIQSTLSKSG